MYGYINTRRMVVSMLVSFLNNFKLLKHKLVKLLSLLKLSRLFRFSGLLDPLRKYFRVWWVYTRNSFEVALVDRRAVVFLLAGKIIRFGFFLMFLILLTEETRTLAGYSLDEVVFLFLTFNFVDVTSQLFLRGIYYFRQKIVSGAFDFDLGKPLSPIFSTLFSRTDVLDLMTWVPLTAYMLYFAASRLEASLAEALVYLILIVNSLILALAFHLLVASVGVLTTEVDHTIWIYRDLVNMGRVPVEIYAPGIRALLTFVVPVSILMNWPAKALYGFLSWPAIWGAVIITGVVFWGSLKVWRYALSQYASASS